MRFCSSCFGSIRTLLLLACAAVVSTGQPACADAPDTEQAKPVGRWQDASVEEYRKHLVALQELTRACAKARNVQSCDPTLVGPDDRVPIGASRDAGRRIVRFGWLRLLFSRAEEPDKAQQAPAPAKPTGQGGLADQATVAAPPTTSQLLEEAQARLTSDLEEATRPAAGLPHHDRERQVLKVVLEGREFRELKQPTTQDSAMERLSAWLNRMFANVDKLRARSAWVGRALIWGMFLAVGVGLAWGLLRLERRWSVRLVPPDERSAPDAASARDWQLWMTDARNAAAAGMWRDAIHFLYWASISRLESKRLWPADRARTPREYLALVASDDPRRDALASLTRMFERTWYGGREADEQDYRSAEFLASSLVSGTVPAAHSGTTPQAVVEGGTA